MQWKLLQVIFKVKYIFFDVMFHLFACIMLTSVGLFLNSSATTVMHKFSSTSQATSPRMRQCSDDYLALQAGCSKVTRDQNR